MMEAKDIISLIIGFLLFVLGLLPMINSFGVGPSWFNLSQFLPVAVFSWIIAVGALYLVINSIIEITNSASVGFVSIIVAFVALVVGVLPILAGFGIGPAFFGLGFLGSASQYVYNGIFIAEGIFLMIAMFAMEM